MKIITKNIKIITKKEIFPISLIIIAFLVGFILYSQLPERIPSHWNSRGEVDSWSSKNFAVLFFPGLALIIYLLMIFFPLIDPLRKNYLKFATVYFWIRTIFVIFFVLLYFYTILASLYSNLNINYFMIFVISVFFIILGIFMPKIKKNYFLGIRTPWTIHSEEVWDRTHRMGGKLFVLAGLVSLAGIFIIDYAFAIFLTAILTATIASVVYSYFVFWKIKGFEQ